MSFSVVLLIVLALIILALAGFVLSLRRKLEGKKDKTEQELDRKNTEMISNITNQIQILSGSIGTIQKSVDQRLGENTSRLDNASRSYAEVQKQLIQVNESVKQMHDVGKNISSLQDILRAPKLRGVMGEFLLENLLAQIFGGDHYEMQYTFKSGEKVDAIVRLKDYLVPIDSKFPLENFQKGSEADERDKDQFSKLFHSDVKKHVDSIAKKYILPDEGTIDYALMYVPSEPVYYEIIANNMEITDYAHKKRVLPVSPSTFYAYMRAILMSFEGKKIEERAKTILTSLRTIKGESDKFAESLRVLTKHINDTKNTSDQVNSRFSTLSSKIEATGVLNEKNSSNLPEGIEK